MSEAGTAPTPVSLLKKLRESATPLSQEAWGKFVGLYTPLLLMWARRLGASEQDAPDLVQDVFVVLAREMPRFHHDPTQRFRGWLWTVVRNKWRDWARRRAAAPAVAGDEALATVAHPNNVEELAEEEYRAYLIGRAIELMKAELPAAEWSACHEYLIQGRPAAEVAAEQGLTVNQVYLAKSRVLRRVRAELEDLLG